MNFINSELRQDLVSGDWIVIAPKRAKKAGQFLKKIKRIKQPIKGCPFENPQETGHGEPLLLYLEAGSKKWLIQVVKNKFPAFTHQNIKALVFKNGPYSVLSGVGHHEVLIMRDHNKNIPHLDDKNVFLVFKAFQERYRSLAKDCCSAYISIFHNWGLRAGASIYHPHCQITSIPVIPPDIQHSFSGSLRYFKKNKECVHCAMIKWEKKNENRIIFENKEAIVFAPFVSREPFELRVFPKQHLPYFEDTSDDILRDIAEALKTALLKMEKHLKDPDYNFFIHTAPVLNKKSYSHYHWHIEILPKVSISAGFELGTGIEITVVDPDDAAKLLRE